MKRQLLFVSVAVAVALAFLVTPAAASAKASTSFKSARLAGARSASVEVRFPFASTLDPDLTVGGETSRDTQCH